MTPPLVVLGDALLDVDLAGAVTRQCPDAPAAPVLDVTQQRQRPGGAGLTALLAAADGAPVRLVTALAADSGGELLRELLAPDVEVVAGPARGATVCKCRLRAGGRTLLRVDRGRAVAEPATARLADALDGAGSVLVSDYGRGLADDPLLRARLRRLAGQVPVVWDPHPCGAVPVPGCALVTPNLEEALRAAARSDAPGSDAPGAAVPRVLRAGRAAARLRANWRACGVVVTLGADGALLHSAAAPDGSPDPAPGTCSGAASRLVPAPRVVVADQCGAGDRFAASAALALRAGRAPPAAVREAVHAASRFVATGGAAGVGRSAAEAGDSEAGDSEAGENAAWDVVERRQAWPQ